MAKKRTSRKLSYHVKEIWSSHQKSQAYASAKKLRGSIVDKYGKKYKVYAKVVPFTRSGKMVEEGIITKKAYKVMYAYKQTK